MKIILFNLFTFLSFLILSQGTQNESPFEKLSKNSINYIESCDFKKPISQTLQLINDYRRKNGLNPLHLDAEMSKFTDKFILQLLEKNVLNHSDLNGGTYSIENLYTQMRFGSILVLDEIWYEQIAQQTFDAWKKSPGHNTNMLNPNITKIGLSFEAKTKSSEGNYSYTLDGILVGK
jgi:uncharacterized protein YkwD